MYIVISILKYIDYIYFKSLCGKRRYLFYNRLEISIRLGLYIKCWEVGFKCKIERKSFINYI